MTPIAQHGRPPSSGAWSGVVASVKLFEDAWRQGPRPALDDHLPADEPLRGRVLIELVQIDLELRLKSGESARVEEYLTRYPALADDRAATLELIAVEHELRRRREPSLAMNEYLLRFPQYGTELQEQIPRPTVDGREAPRRL